MFSFSLFIFKHVYPLFPTKFIASKKSGFFLFGEFAPQQYFASDLNVLRMVSTQKRKRGVGELQRALLL